MGIKEHRKKIQRDIEHLVVKAPNNAVLLRELLVLQETLAEYIGVCEAARILETGVPCHAGR